ncbi:MAG: sulfotransferase [Verrucomicrobia bacterium]|nr:sulfotransferase [Verrucomicrobiota bacterium]
MYLNLGLTAKALYLSYLGRPFQLRRWVIVTFFLSLLICFWVVVAIGRALDHILYPEFRRQKIRQPVFIIAPPRSGTTFLQKLLAKNRGTFAPVLMYQTIFPSITIQKIIQSVALASRQKGGLLFDISSWIERHCFGGWDGMHKMRFAEPEEDDGYFVYTFVTEAIYLLFPFVRALWGAGFADDLPPRQRRRLMRYYRSCLQRHLYLNGPEKILLSKATQLSGSIDSLKLEFPDARIVNILRNPVESIPSHISVFYTVWNWVDPSIGKKSRESLEYAELAAAWFLHLEKNDITSRSENYLRIFYTDLVRHPDRAARSIYRHFGIPLTPSATRRIQKEAKRALEYKSSHQYTLEEYGLSSAWIKREVGGIMKRYDFRFSDRPTDRGSKR